MARAKSPIYVVPFKRRREGKTIFKKRLALLESRKPRLVVRKTNRNMIVQIIAFMPEGDRTLVAVNSKKLKEYGWVPKRNMPTSYLSGFLAGKMARAKGITGVVLDIGRHTPSFQSIVFAALKGAIDAGMDSKLGMELSEERIKGVHIAEYAKLIKEDKEKYSRQFSEYVKNKVEPEKLPELFEKVKAKISES
jgi:large subunit ribosomal protein L18